MREVERRAQQLAQGKLPNGKREPAKPAKRTDADIATLERELREELGVELDVHSARRLGEFEDDAVNEPGRLVRGEVYAVSVSGIPRASAEIAELRWIDPRGEADCHIAPLSARHILPAFLAGLD